MRDGFTGQRPNQQYSIKVLKEEATKENPENANTKYTHKYETVHAEKIHM